MRTFETYFLPPAEESIKACIELGLITRGEEGKIKAVEQPPRDMPVECHHKQSYYAKR